MNKKELIKLLDKYEIEYEITDNTKEVEEGLRLLDEALEKIGIIIPKETQINNITRENDPEVPKYTTEWTNSSDLVFRLIHSKHTETHECDCISRRDALKPFCITSDGTRIPEVDCDNFPVEFNVKDIKRHLLSLPPVEPKRPKGEWIVDSTELKLTCSECKATFSFDDVDELLDFKEDAKFCIECGAKMKGGTE